MAFTPEAIQRSIAAGVKCIEHGFPMDEATARRKIAAITLTLWKKGEDFDIDKLNSQAA